MRYSLAQTAYDAPTSQAIPQPKIDDSNSKVVEWHRLDLWRIHRQNTGEALSGQRILHIHRDQRLVLNNKGELIACMPTCHVTIHTNAMRM
jgi:hypothetical protein